MTFTISAEAISAIAISVGSHEPFKFGGFFFQQAHTTTAPGDAESWTLLGMAFTGAFDTTDHRDPYGSPASSAITSDDIPELKPIVPAVTVAAVRARLADLVWLRARDITMARLAVDSYLKAAQDAESAKDWAFCPRYAERGARLAIQIKAIDHEVFGYLRHLGETYQHGDARFVTTDAVRVLAELHLASAAELLPLLVNLASALMSAGEYHAARHAFDQMVHLARGINDRAIEREGHVGFARSYEIEAAYKAQVNSHGVAAGLYQFAIEAYQRAGNARAEIDRIRPLLAAAEIGSLSELRPLGRQDDSAHIVAGAVKQVAGLPWPDALVAFVGLHPICDYDELRQITISAAQHSPLMSMVTRKTLEARGQTVARQPGMSLNEDDENEQAVVGQMLQNLLLSRRGTVAQCIIAPALQQLNLEHDISLRALTDFIAYTNSAKH